MDTGVTLWLAVAFFQLKQLPQDGDLEKVTCVSPAQTTVTPPMLVMVRPGCLVSSSSRTLLLLDR